MVTCCVCNLEAVVKCTCNKKKYCTKDYDKHAKKPGNHEAINLEDSGAIKKGVSFAGSDDQKEKEKHKEFSVISIEDDKKALLQRVLEIEIAKLQRFKMETLSCLGSQQQSLIKSIITDSKKLTNTVITECKSKEEQLESTIDILNVVGKIPFGNPIIERIKKCGENESIIKAKGILNPTFLQINKTIDSKIDWLGNPIIEDLRAFFESNKLSIPPKIKKLYEKIFAEKHYTIKKISLNKAKIDLVTLPYFLRIVKFFPSIKELRLGGNKLNSENSDGLAECLVSFKNISKLDLSDNDLRGHGIEVLTPVLVEMKNLTILSLAKNGLGATGSRHLSLMLENLKKIKELDLDGNGLGTEGARYISAALPKLTQIKVLKLRNNNMTDESVKFLKGAFGRMINIELIKLENNRFGNEEKKTMNLIVRKECKIEF